MKQINMNTIFLSRLLTRKISICIFEYYQLGVTTQQCPIDFPFSFHYGASCCYYGQDNDGNAISKHSQTCFHDRYRLCPRDRCVDNSKRKIIVFPVIKNLITVNQHYYTQFHYISIFNQPTATAVLW